MPLHFASSQRSPPQSTGHLQLNGPSHLPPFRQPVQQAATPQFFPVQPVVHWHLSIPTHEPCPEQISSLSVFPKHTGTVHCSPLQSGTQEQLLGAWQAPCPPQTSCICSRHTGVLQSGPLHPELHVHFSGAVHWPFRLQAPPPVTKPLQRATWQCFPVHPLEH